MIELDKEKLYKLYKLEGWSIAALEKEFGVCNLTIKNNLKFYNIVRDEKDKIKAKEFRVQRTRENNLKKYGVDNVSKLKEVREKVAEGNKKFQEKLKAEGKPSYFATEEGKAAVKKAVREKYGVDNINQLDIHRERMRKNWEGKTKEQKRAWIKRCREAQTEEVQDRITEKKRRNNSFHISSWEKLLTEKISEKFPDLKIQYKEERYPFHCDFYIPSLDLFIECNFHWTHGRKLFDPNNEKDLEQLKRWEELGKNATSVRDKGQYYKNAIVTWTQLDVRKYETAKTNKLNYKIFYFLKDALNWIDSQ